MCLPHGPPTGSELSRSRFASLLAAGDQGFRIAQLERLSDFKMDIKGAQEEAAAKAASRVRHEKPYEYKKSHEEQAMFNAKALKEATDALDDTADSPAILWAKTAVKEGKHLLAERQKLIKIADRSANRWSVVAETSWPLIATTKRGWRRLKRRRRGRRG